MSSDNEHRFRHDVAAKLKERSRAVSMKWLEVVTELLTEDEREAFPGEGLLDHIPDLVSALADDLASPVEGRFVDSLVTSKATELGEIRHRQNASVHQLLREYEHLIRLIDELVLETTRGLDYDVSLQAVLSTSHRLGFAVRTLMRTTVDTFIERYAAKIQSQHEQLESFNRMVSHELRDSVHSIGLAVDLLGSEEPTGLPRARAIIRRSVDRARSVLVGLEYLATDHDGDEHDPAHQEIDLGTFVQGLADELGEHADAFGVEIRVGELPRVVADVANLDLVLTNLLSNAIKYADQERHERWVEVTEVDDASDGTVTLCVRDNGVGIDPEALPKVFDRGHRGAGHASPAVDGHGLGLYIVKRCVETMRGEIRIESKPGEGTAAYVVMPVARVGTAATDGA